MPDYKMKIQTISDMWKLLIPQPEDFTKTLLDDPVIKKFIQKIEVT